MLILELLLKDLRVNKVLKVNVEKKATKDHKV